jgi:hypothetical protein
MDNFVQRQQDAWQAIVTEMLGEPLFCIINGGSVNGPGSSLRYTEELRDLLPKLLQKYGITTMLDAPCGDRTWTKKLDLGCLHSYLGFDVDPRIINTNKLETTDERFVFVCTNLLTKKKFPKVDVILCRDFLAHLTNPYIGLILNKFKTSGSRYLLASNYPGSGNEFEYKPEEYPWNGYLERQHDLTLEPFNLTRIDGIPEDSPPGDVLANEHELALFDLDANDF